MENRKLIALESESGVFLVDEDGVAREFQPAADNLFVNENTDMKIRYSTYSTTRKLRTFVVPEGVKAFVSDFLRNTYVVEKFELPNSLLSIGCYSSSAGHYESCVFANCILPKVVIPEGVKMLGDFAFYHSYIDVLQLPTTIRSRYGRQFNDSHINTLILPVEWYLKYNVRLNNHRLFFKSERPSDNQSDPWGYMERFFAYVKELLFIFKDQPV